MREINKDNILIKERFNKASEATRDFFEAFEKATKITLLEDKNNYVWGYDYDIALEETDEIMSEKRFRYFCGLDNSTFYNIPLKEILKNVVEIQVEKGDEFLAWRDVLKIQKPDDLYTGEKFTCTETVAGEKCCNGGEYGFYTSYYPTRIKGIYEVVCESTGFNDKFVGYIYLTNSEVEKLKVESDAIEMAGSLY